MLPGTWWATFYNVQHVGARIARPRTANGRPYNHTMNFCCYTERTGHRPLRLVHLHGVYGAFCGGEGELEIVSPCVAVYVEDFSGEVEVGDVLGLHGV